MTALAYRPEPSARADTDEMREAMFLASQEGIDYCDALKRVQEYDPNPPTPAEVAEAFRFKYL